MKKFILVAGLLVCCVVLVMQTSATPGNVSPFANLKMATFRWSQTAFDFGKVKQNIPVTHRFTFTNNGDSPLVISSVQASCGCTVAEYSKDPIEPGSEGFVKATFNAAQLGIFAKTVTVNANTENGPVLLSVKGIVVE